MSQIQYTRSGSKIRVNIIITVSLIAGILAGLWLFADVIWWLLLAGGVVGVLSGGAWAGVHIAIKYQALRAAIETRRRASLTDWHADYLAIPANGFITVDGGLVQPFYASKAPQIVSGTALALPEPEQREGLLDLIDYSEHFMMVGSTQSGKTTAMIHLALAYQQRGAVVTVLDIHAVKNPWPDHFTVIGKGRDFDGVAAFLQRFHAKLTTRAKTGQDAPEEIAVIDEWLAVVDNCLTAGLDVRQYMREIAQEGAKFGLRLILAGQGDGVEELGAQGRKSVRENFRRVYFSHRWKSRNVASLTKTGEPEFIDLPGPYHAAARLTDEERIVAAAETATSYRAICRAVGWQENGREIERVKEILQANGVDLI